MNKKEQALKYVPPTSSSKETLDFLLVEYSALRAEILKRTEIQLFSLSMALVATGTFLTIGSTTAAFTYPFLAMFLAAAWAQSDFRIVQLGTYIRTRIEQRFLKDNEGWENFFSRTPDVSIGRFVSFAYFASRGVFIGTQILTVIIPLLTKSKSLSTEDIVLLISDGLVIILTIYLLRKHKLPIEQL